VSHRASFLETPDRPVVIVHVEPQQLVDALACRRLRLQLGRALGGTPVILRCVIGSEVVCDGEPYLRHHAFDPEIDTLPVVWLDLDLDDPSAEAA
jgi:hypothetical protein